MKLKFCLDSYGTYLKAQICKINKVDQVFTCQEIAKN